MHDRYDSLLTPVLSPNRSFACPPVPTNPESDARYGSFDFRAAHAAAPADLQELLDQHESLPFRRRGYERDGMLKTVVERAGESPADAHTRYFALPLTSFPQPHYIVCRLQRAAQSLPIRRKLLQGRGARSGACRSQPLRA